VGRFGRALSLCLAISVASSVAIAQPAPPAPPPAPEIQRPNAIGDTGVAYPEGAHGDAVVVLELVIGPNGAVKDVTVVSGAAPFSEQAATSAWNWHFEPARRKGVPVAARVRFEVRFKEPPAPVAPEAPTAPTAPGPEAPAPAPRELPRAKAKQEIEVVVIGEKPTPGVRSFTRAEVRELPGTFGDPFRAIEALPGVTPLVSGVPYFFVRGAPPGNVGYFLDGIRVPLLYHVGLGPSVVNPAMVDRVDLYPGGYPARYGRFAGGIVAGETTPPRPDFHGEASVRLIDAGALVEAPIADGRGTVLAGGRYSYTGLLFSLLNPDAVLEYWDYQLRASYDVAPRDTLAIFSFGSYDYVGDKSHGPTETVLGTEFHRVDLRWDHQESSRTNSRLALMLGYDRTRTGQDQAFSLRDRIVGLRSEIKSRADAHTILRAGSDVTLDHYDVIPPPFDANNPDDSAAFARLFPTRSDLAMGMWGEVSVEVERGITLTPGLRVDAYASDGAGAVAVEPRMAARFELTRHVRSLYALGLATQPPSFVVPVPGFQIGGLSGGLQKSLQSSAGVETDLPESFTASLTLFQNVFFDMTDALGSSKTDNTADFNSRSTGSGVGLEVMVRRPLTKKLGGYLSYTLSRSMRSVGREHFPSAFDRTHVLNLALAYDLGRHWRAGTRLVFYTGFPAEERSDTHIRSESPARVPPFYRVDVRLEKRWRLGEHGYWAFIAEMLNATLSKEVVDVSCYTNGCKNTTIGPVAVPSIGVEASF
jgi:TonB family protein